jgi:ribonucleoside-diphosphate reductase alpha chain
MAIAPTATISTIAGTSQSIEPNFSNLFARKNIEGKFIEINENLVAELKKLRLWDRVKENIIAKQSNIQDIKEIPIAIKARFRTAYEIDPKIVIEYAARAQKWVDMAISRNLYFSGKDVNKIIDAYLYAWRAGLKSTYYAFFKTSMTLQPQYIYKEQHKVIRETMPVKFGICEACQ